MTLIADSGSTKTDWLIADAFEKISDSIVIKTQGINPVHMSAETIDDILRRELLPNVNIPIARVAFFGAGCTAGAAERMAEALRVNFPNASIEVQTDLLGAARALLGKRAGIACILGTGSNSCLYDGRQIRSNVPPLGYILGDEGSGASLGRIFLNAMYKGLLPDRVRKLFEDEEGLSYPAVIERVYRQPSANRFLAGLSPFVSRHSDIPEVNELVNENFRAFFSRNILAYRTADLQTISAVGSIAFFFEKNLRQVAGEFGFTLDKVLKSPLRALAEYSVGEE